jgi:hypothetical protein
VQALILRVVAPDDADVEHVQVIVGAGMHAAVAVVMPVGHDHAGDVVGILGRDAVVDAVEFDIERPFARALLYRFSHQVRYVVDVPGQFVAMPE